MTHKLNQERVNKEKKRIEDIERRCQDAIKEILTPEGLEARIVFYPR